LSDQLKGLIITTLGVLCVVPDALFIRLIEANAMTVAFWRLLLSGLVILLMVLIQHGKHTPAKIVAIGRWGVLYAFLAAASALLFVTSVKLTTVANTTVILASMPVFAALISWLVLGETPSRRTLWTIALVVVGLLVIGYGTYTNDTGTDDTGIALLILMESILAPLLVWFVVGEEPGFWTLIGGALVLGVLCVSNVVALRNSSRRSYQSVS